MTDEDQNMLMTRPQAGVANTRGFGSQSMERRAETAATAVAERAKAEIQALCVMAMQRPRDLANVRIRLLEHVKRTGFAQKARYSKPVGKTKIVGPSIRFVETALQEYGNVMPEVTVVYEDDERLILRVSVTDFERNIKHADEAIVTKRVERRYLAKGQRAISERTNSYGEPVFLVEATDDEVMTKKGAIASKLIRNLGLRILPADLVDEAMELCVDVIARGVAADPNAEKKKLMDAFHGVGVMPSDVAEYLGHSLDAIQPAELMDLRTTYQSLRDGETTWKQVIAAKREQDDAAAPPPAKDDKAPKGAAGLKSKLSSKKAKDDAPPPAAEPKVELSKSYAGEVAKAAPPADDVPEWKGIEVIERLEARLERVGETGDLFEIVEAIEALAPGPGKDRLLRLAASAAKAQEE